ncbi:MAG: hypothetical protein VSS75_023580 [Candidatus Parabeggiatoa sp.]|nr:hypothetical protein [Candidatus Parabeggiatoa sp.]
MGIFVAGRGLQPRPSRFVIEMLFLESKPAPAQYCQNDNQGQCFNKSFTDTILSQE